MTAHHTLLLIDDSPGEQELFRLALAQTGRDIPLFTEQDAQAAWYFLTNHPELPALILLDWNLGKERGEGFLKRLRAEARLAAVPVVVFTTSDNAADLSAAYACGASGYVVKPDTFDELVQCAADICRYWMDRNRTVAMVTTSC